MSVLIMGAGIGGLTAAHILAQRGFKVTVIERNDTIGGLARSSYSKLGLPTEYCWRIYGPKYVHLKRILREIPSLSYPGRSVLNHLMEIDQHVASDRGSTFTFDNDLSTLRRLRRHFPDIPIHDLWALTRSVIEGFLSNADTLSSVTWRDFLGPLRSPYLEKWAVYSVAPFLGEDLDRVSAAAIFQEIKGLLLTASSSSNLSVMDGPTSDVWFDAWHRFLVDSLHVDILTGENITKIEIDDHSKRINGVWTASRYFQADHYVCGLDVTSAAKLLSVPMPNLLPLSQLGFQQMVGVQLFLSHKFTFGYKVPSANVCHKAAIYLPESQWQLVIELQGYVWNYHSQHPIKDIWSIGLDDPNTPGLLVRKPFPQCSRLELRLEVWHQILNCSQLGHVMISDDGRTRLKDAQVLDFELWYTYKYHNGLMTTYEPKFSDNALTYQLEPRIHDKSILSNLYFATAYTKSKRGGLVYNMEKASICGFEAAREILSSN